MSGPTQPWDQSEDPRESTVDLPRLDLSELGNRLGGAAPGASARPAEPGFGGSRNRDHGSGEPALPQPAALLEPLPGPDSGRFLPPGRRPASAGFMDPYAQPHPRGDFAPPRSDLAPPRREFAPPRAGGPMEVAPPPSLARRGEADSGRLPRPAPRASDGRLPGSVPYADGDVSRLPGPVPRAAPAEASRLPTRVPYADASRLPDPVRHADADQSRIPRPVPGHLPDPVPYADADQNRMPRPVPVVVPGPLPRSAPDAESDAARLLDRVRLAIASSPGQASVADFAVGPVDASLALSLTPVSEAQVAASADPALVGPALANGGPAAGRGDMAEAEPATGPGEMASADLALSLDPIADATPAAANPSSASTGGADIADDDPGRRSPRAADTESPAVAQVAASRQADPVRASEVATPLARTPGHLPPDRTPGHVEADETRGLGTPDGTPGHVTADRGAPDSARPVRPDRQARAARPRAGSIADLRSRLTRLPDGHPSSPYDDGGQARPLPTRLRQLELGLPAPGRDLRAGSWADVDIDHTGLDRANLDQARFERDSPDPAPLDPVTLDSAPTELAHFDRARPHLPALDDGRPEDLTARSAAPAPDEPLSAPDGAGPPSAAARAHLPASSAPDERRASRSEWQDPYAGGSSQAASSRPGDLALGPWQPRTAAAPGPLDRLSPGRGDGHGNGTNGNVNGYEPHATSPPPNRPENRRPEPRRIDPRQHDGRQLDARQHDAHRLDTPRLDTPRRDPRQLDPLREDARQQDARQQDQARRDTVQRPVRPPSAAQPDSELSRRSPDASRPEPADDLRALVEHTLASCRAAEGRNVFGGYGSSGLTPLIHRMAAQLPFGGLADGSEADTLKPPDRFAAKLARLMARNPGRPPEELAASVGDAVRYAFAFEDADYTEGTWLVHRRLKSHGFELEVRRNRWANSEHKGIFTMWRDPAHGLAFEVQFHTTASWALLRKTHDIYVQITDPATPPTERARLRARQAAASATAEPPPNWAEISDFRLEPR